MIVTLGGPSHRLSANLREGIYLQPQIEQLSKGTAIAESFFSE